MNLGRRIYPLSYIAIAISILLVVGSINWMKYYHLSTEGVQITATVTSTTCESHMTFSYHFQVGQEVVKGIGNDGYGNPSCAVLRQGDSVVVCYLPSQPKINAPGNAKARLNNETTSVALAALFGPIIPVFAIYRWNRKRRA